MKLKSTAIALALVAVFSSAAFAAQPATCAQPSQTLLSQILTPQPPINPATAPADTLVPPTLSSICSPCTPANCQRICHQPSGCSFDPDTGCSFCSCFLP
ncbi:MAG TPA: hypothetical protein VF173_34780 [Thermoanaerobaculia bacterium]|nr:hypothetical protein [Thermoanaerobaculia bacterium]